MSYQSMEPRELAANVFDLIGKQWMLVTAGDARSLNTMTASWGGLGELWGKHVAFVFVRPTRYTYEYLERGDTFSLTFYGEEHREALNLCGAKSGRDVDKVAACGFTVALEQGIPYFEEAALVLLCRKLYAQDIDPACFTDATLDTKWYHGDYHRMYVAEIIKVLQK